MRTTRKSNKWFLLLLLAGVAELFLEHTYFDEHKLAPLRLHIEVARFDRQLTSTYFWPLVATGLVCLLGFVAFGKRGRF